MKKLSKKLFRFLVQSLAILGIIFCLGSNLALAQANPNQTDQNNPASQNNTQNNSPDSPNHVIVTPTSGIPIQDGYQLLAPLSDKLKTFDTNQSCAFGEYLDIMISLFIGICAVLAVIMIVVGGIEYMTSELVSSKEHGKGQMTQAVLGLILALGAWLILNQLNPNLLKLCLDKLPSAPISIEGDENSIPYAGISDTEESKFGIYCPGSVSTDPTERAKEIQRIAQSFAGKVTYSQSRRGTHDDSTLYLDCSSYVAQVYKCAGLGSVGTSTGVMFNGEENITNISGDLVNGEKLQAGDILGWKKGESKRFPKAGHAIIYIGNGSFMEVSGKSGRNGAVRLRPLIDYATELRHVIRIAFN